MKIIDYLVGIFMGFVLLFAFISSLWHLLPMVSSIGSKIGIIFGMSLFYTPIGAMVYGLLSTAWEKED